MAVGTGGWDGDGVDNGVDNSSAVTVTGNPQLAYSVGSVCVASFERPRSNAHVTSPRSPTRASRIRSWRGG